MQDGCKACAYFEDHAAKAGSRDAGFCHFNPPIPQAEPNKHALWPVVTADDWCSRFESQAA